LPHAEPDPFFTYVFVTTFTPGPNNSMSLTNAMRDGYKKTLRFPYGITVFSVFIIQAYQNPLIVSLFAPLLAALSFVSISCWAIGGDLFRHLLNKYYRWFNWAMGALLIYTAIASLF
jgi:threonine/homoserine/homoserine lactone efflux protein